jgi:hypothetical protein
VPTMRTAVALALIVVSLGLVAAGCGGDDEPQATATEEWAEGFCTAVTTWTSEIERIADELADLSSFSSEALEDAAQEADDATNTFVDDVQDLDEPGTESSQEVEDSIDALADTVEAERAEIEGAADDITGIGDIASSGAEIASSVAAMLTALQETLQAIENAEVGSEIETAFEQAPACDDVFSSSG